MSAAAMTPRGAFLLDALEASRRIRKNRPGAVSLREGMDAMTKNDWFLAAAIMRLDDESYPFREFMPMGRARNIVDGFEPWPRALLAWKEYQELRCYHGHGMGPKPPWIDRAPAGGKHRSLSPADISRRIQRKIERRTQGRA